MLYDALVIGVGLWLGFLFITGTALSAIKVHEWAKDRWGKHYYQGRSWR